MLNIRELFQVVIIMLATAFCTAMVLIIMTDINNKFKVEPVKEHITVETDSFGNTIDSRKSEQLLLLTEK